jgi:hypothetical protein
VVFWEDSSIFGPEVIAALRTTTWFLSPSRFLKTGTAPAAVAYDCAWIS